MSVTVNGTPVAALATRVNQATRKGRVRKTLALPNTPIWFPMGNLNVKAGDTVEVSIARASTKKGWIVADAIRLLKP